jgi:hypothetical protein
MTLQLLRKPQITLSNKPSGAAAAATSLWRLCCGLSGLAVCILTGPWAPADQPQEKTAGQAWQTRMDNLFGGVDDMVPFEGAGAMWARRHSGRGQAVAGGPMRRFISNHTWEQMPEPTVDVYDAKPIAVLGPEVAPAVHHQQANDEQPESSRRLKTDIRTIKPSLSYALRDIDSTQLPADYDSRLDKGEYVARQMSPAVLQWAPTNFYHYPLYFEDPALERYGHAWHPLIQPAISTGRFAGQLVGLPYQMVLHPVHSRQYALGYYRPGEPAPKKHYQIPWNNEAVVMQTAVVVGLFLIMP